MIKDKSNLYLSLGRPEGIRNTYLFDESGVLVMMRFGINGWNF